MACRVRKQVAADGGEMGRSEAGKGRRPACPRRFEGPPPRTSRPAARRPQGEGPGDAGWLAQLEARYRLGTAEPYLFYDAGAIRINAKPEGITPPVTDNTRFLSGAGLGLRLASGPWNLDAAIAWRIQGGKPQSDSHDRHPRAWLAAGWRF